MLDSYIRYHQVKLLEDTYSDDLERLKAITYGLEYILNGMEYNIETDEDEKEYNTLTTCLMKLKEITSERNEEEREVK